MSHADFDLAHFIIEWLLTSAAVLVTMDLMRARLSKEEREREEDSQ